MTEVAATGMVTLEEFMSMVEEITRSVYPNLSEDYWHPEDLLVHVQAVAEIVSYALSHPTTRKVFLANLNQ